jgi:chromosome segregation ATPase
MSSGGEDYLQKELKNCRHQLSQAERRATAACENRDALVLKLEEATDKVAELERTLQVQAHQGEVFANELAEKESALAAGEKGRADLDVKLSMSRMNASRLKEKLSKSELEAEARTKSIALVEAELATEKEKSALLQRELDEMTGKQSLLLKKLNETKDTVSSLEKEALIASSQIRALEKKLAARESEFEKAKREAAESRKAKQAHKDAVFDTANTKKELRHLGMELLREQANLEEHAAQQKTESLVRSRREEKNGGKKNSPISGEDLSTKVAVLQRRLIAEKEAAAKLGTALEQKEEELLKVKKALEVRMEGDLLQKEVSHLRAQLLQKSKEQRAAKAEVAALQAELSAAMVSKQ